MCYKLCTILRELFTVKNLSAVSCLMEQENVKMLRFILFCMINVTLPPLVSLIYHFYSFSAFIKHFKQNDWFYCHVQLCFPDFKYAEWMTLKKEIAFNNFFGFDTWVLEEWWLLMCSFESNSTSRKMLAHVSFLQLFKPGKALILQTLKLCYGLGMGGVGVRK